MPRKANGCRLQSGIPARNISSSPIVRGHSIGEAATQRGPVTMGDNDLPNHSLNIPAGTVPCVAAN